jgi:hypothetical protein
MYLLKPLKVRALLNRRRRRVKLTDYYGLAIGDWPLIGSNVVTLAMMSVILASKLRYG